MNYLAHACSCLLQIVLFAGDQYVTVSYVVPCVLSLNTHLHDMKIQTKYCGPLLDALLSSLKCRFRGIFERSGLIGVDIHNEGSDNTEGSKSKAPESTSKKPVEPSPFSDDIYFISAVLNPAFGIKWIECDIGEPDVDEDDVQQTRDNLRQRMQGWS